MTASVTIRPGRFAARVASPSKAVTDAIKAAVPPAGREYDAAAREWIIFSSKVPRLVAALRAAGVEVAELPADGAV